MVKLPQTNRLTKQQTDRQTGRPRLTLTDRKRKKMLEIGRAHV